MQYPPASQIVAANLGMTEAQVWQLVEQGHLTINDTREDDDDRVSLHAVRVAIEQGLLTPEEFVQRLKRA